MSDLKPRFNQHSVVNDVIKNDWIRAIELDPENYDALLYLPKEVEVDDSEDIYEEAIHLELDENQKSLDYELPVVVKMVDNSEPQQQYDVEQDGVDGLGDSGQMMMVKVGLDSVPIGAILEWMEVLGDNTERRVWWYVHSAKTIGTTTAGKHYFLIPCRDFDNVTVV